MHKRTILATGLLLVGLLFSAASITAENRSMTDITGDVMSMDINGNTTIVTSNPEMNINDIDITNVTCNNNTGSVTMSVTVAGTISDRGTLNDIYMSDENVDYYNLTINTIGYSLNITTNESLYMATYVNGTCRLALNEDTTNTTPVTNFSKHGNTLTITFKLDTPQEVIQDFGAQTIFMKANMTAFMNGDVDQAFYYLSDSAPNAPLTIENAGTDQTLAAPGTPIQFTCSVVVTTGQFPYTYHWDFGDHQTSTEQNPTHTYTQAGSYTYNCTVTDSGGTTQFEVGTIKIQSGGGGNTIGSGNMILIFIAIIVIIAIAGVAIVIYLIRR